MGGLVRISTSMPSGPRSVRMVGSGGSRSTHPHRGASAMHEDDTPIEEWRPVVGYEGYYEVSNLGRVRSLVRMVRNRWGLFPRRGVVLKPGPTADGHLNVVLCREGRRDTQSVHRLVLSAFVGPCPPRHEGAHWDRDPSNNHLSNLRWATKSQNYDDRRRHGTDNAGARHGIAVDLTKEDIVVIRRLLAECRATQAELARIFGVGQTTISRINRDAHWTMCDPNTDPSGLE